MRRIIKLQTLNKLLMHTAFKLIIIDQSDTQNLNTNKVIQMKTPQLNCVNHIVRYACRHPYRLN